MNKFAPPSVDGLSHGLFVLHYTVSRFLGAFVSSIAFVLKYLFELLLPTSCLVCGKEGSYLCRIHKKKLRKHYNVCYVCGLPTRFGETCLDHKSAPCDGVVLGFYYTSIVRECIHHLKYNYGYEIGSMLAAFLQGDILGNPILQQAIRKKLVVISYVPMNQWKERYKRGYNQAKLLAEELSCLLDVPCLSMCIKKENTRSQTAFSRGQRVENSRRVFGFDETAEKKEIYQRFCTNGCGTVLLVDDVLTTGATLDACAHIIRERLPNMSIRGVCVARNDQ